MKTIGIVLAWFLFIGLLASFVSCSSTVHCDAYGQTEQVQNKSVSKLFTENLENWSSKRGIYSPSLLLLISQGQILK